jgi:catechol 2,3-dioxygenase-like lactoylglutathione lyase family enzyme
MIGYVTIGTDQLERARAFYDSLLAEIGARRLLQLEETGFTLYGTAFGKPGLAVTKPYNREPAVAGNGNMVAMTVESRDMVDRLHAKALELGGTDEGAPGLRAGGEGPRAFYGAYFRDLDGNKICVFKVGPAA